MAEPTKALLVIDMLNDFVREGAPLEVPEARRVLPVIRAEIDRARLEGSRVIFLCDRHRPDDPEFAKFGWPPHAVKGTPGAEVVAELAPDGSDRVIEKTTYSPFMDTELDDVLREAGITKLVLTGCVTHICVLFTAYEATLHDYRVSVVEKGVAGLESDDHEAAFRIMKNVLGVTLV